MLFCVLPDSNNKDNTREGGSFVGIICYLFLSASSRVL